MFEIVPHSPCSIHCSAAPALLFFLFTFIVSDHQIAHLTAGQHVGLIYNFLEHLESLASFYSKEMALINQHEQPRFTKERMVSVSQLNIDGLALPLASRLGHMWEVFNTHGPPIHTLAHLLSPLLTKPNLSSSFSFFLFSWLIWASGYGWSPPLFKALPSIPLCMQSNRSAALNQYLLHLS